MMKVPMFKDPAVTKFLTEYLRELDREGKDVLNSHTANKSLLLYSPSGKRVYEVTVDEDGVIQTEKRMGV
jgi:hypothetical protein